MEYYCSLFNTDSSTATNPVMPSHNNQLPTWDLVTSFSSASPGPHLTTCLKLGKRHYFEEDDVVHLGDRRNVPFKKAKPPAYHHYYSGAPLPRCQVEGCDAVLVSAKEYHRRHKVCEPHAKAPRVVVHGADQRFCQQCSRFHAVGEFDESKRSCRRRLAGHNQRRRKGFQDHNSLPKKPSQVDIRMTAAAAVGRHTGDCALSLLSSPATRDSWNPPPPPSADLPARCSAALRELIAENRASVLAARRQLIYPPNHYLNAHENDHYRRCRFGWAGTGPVLQEEGGGNVTLDLMQAPGSAFGPPSLNNNNDDNNQRSSLREGDGGRGCSELWKVPLGY